jgi:CRISPR/Cas system-associated exonuclease Cas4 (RecB family)
MQMPPWTYSQLDNFETCPRKFYHLKVARDIVEPPSTHAEWGARVHTAFEEWIKNGSPLPEGMTQWQSLAEKLAKLPGEKLCEQKMALDKNFQPTDWKTSWTRGIADLLVVHKDRAVVADYKTGKRKPTEQLDLYAAYTFAHYPQVKVVTTAFVWLKDRKIDKKEVTRDEVPIVWSGFLPRVRKLESAYERDSWPERPSGLCRAYCPVYACKFNGQKGK